MDRYTVESNDLYDMEKVPDGMWVLFDDVQAAIRAAVAEERARCCLLFRPHQWNANARRPNVDNNRPP